MTHCDMGGAEMIALRLIEGLAGSENPAGSFEFELFAVLDDNPGGMVGRNIAERCARVGCTIVHGSRRSFRRGGVVEAAWRLARTVRVRRPAVVHLHCEIAELTYAVAQWLDPRLRRQPVMRTVHNTELWIEWHAIGRWTTRQLAHADVVAVSHAAALADQAILGNERVADVIHNGVQPPPPREHGAARDPFRLVFAGRFVAQKGADLLPAIFADAAAQVPGRRVAVTIAGQGIYRDALAAASAPPGWRVELVPPIAGLTARLHEFDGVIMPSRHEGFGLFAIEALMAGVPIVVTAAPGLDEVLPAGWPLAAPVDDVAALAHRLARLIADPAPFLARAASLRDELAARWSEQAMLGAYAARYRGMARSKRDRAAVTQMHAVGDMGDASLLCRVPGGSPDLGAETGKMQAIRISIGIKALNEERHIAQSLASACAVAEHVPYPVEVILADSGSTDRTVTIARDFASVRIVQLAHCSERSCGAGAQAAFQTATGTYFYLLDGDMVLDPGFIAAGVAFLEANPGHAGVGGLVREANTASIEFAARARNDLISGSARAGDVDRLDCGGLYRVSAIRAARYFADRNLRAFEEFDLAARLTAQGWKLARLAAPAVTHHGHDLPGLALIWRRIRSGYAGGTGQIARAAWGRPHMAVVARRFSHLRHALVVVAWWAVLLAAIAFWLANADGRWLLGLCALIVAPLAFLSWRRGSVRFGVYSLATWMMHGVGLIQGLFQPRRAPEHPIDLVVLQDGAA